MCRKHGGRWPASRLWERFSGFQSSHGKRRTTQRRRARRRLAARRSFALTSVKAVGQSLRVLLLDVPLSSSTEELEGQTAEKAEKRQTQYQRYVARFCLNSALGSRGEPRRPRFQIRNLLRTERSLCLSLLFKGFFFFPCTACLSQAIAFSRGWRLHPHITKLTASSSFPSLPGRMREIRRTW